MNLKPRTFWNKDHEAVFCPACGCGREGHPKLRFCAGVCIHGESQWVEVTTVSSNPVPHLDVKRASVRQPHVHVTCAACGFEWLEQPADPDGVARALGSA